MITVLTNATLSDGSVVDVEVEDGRVVAVRPAGAADVTPTTAAGATVATGTATTGTATAAALADTTYDLTGYLLLPAAADAHAHLDKAFSWDAIAPPAGDLATAVASFSAFQRAASEQDILARARAAAFALIENGTTAIRSHVSLIDGDDPLRAVRALVALRAELSGLADLQLVVLTTHAASDDAIAAALDVGADLLGGAPHLSPDPIAQTRRLVALAEQHGVGIDLHVDEDLHDAPTLGLYAELVREWPADRRATAGHCVRLGTLPAGERDALIESVVESRIGVVTLPLTNLYLQGWNDPVATPRGVAPVRELLAAGAAVGAGGDNVRDPFNPLGRSDPFETAMLLVAAAHLSPAEAWALVSDGSRRVLDLPLAGTRPGLVADLLAVRADTLAQAIAEAPAERLVFRRGRLIARRTVTRMRAWDRSAPAVAEAALPIGVSV